MTSPQSVRCPKHGFYYQPGREKGCVKCLEGSSRSFSFMTPIVLLLVLGGLGWGGYRFFESMGDRGGELYAETVQVESRIDPALVRARLQRLENLIYAKDIEPYSQGSRIQRACMELYAGVMSKTSQLLAARHGNAIVGFGNLASASEDVGYSTINMDYVQREWEVVRAKVFHEAAWFKTAAR